MKTKIISLACILLAGCASTEKKEVKTVERTIYNVREVAGTTINRREVRELLRSQEDLLSVSYNRYIDPNNPDVMYLDGKLVRVDRPSSWITTPNELPERFTLEKNIRATDIALAQEFQNDVVKQKQMIKFLKGQNQLLINSIKSSKQLTDQSKQALEETAKLKAQCDLLANALQESLTKLKEQKEDKFFEDVTTPSPAKKKTIK